MKLVGILGCRRGPSCTITAFFKEKWGQPPYFLNFGVVLREETNHKLNR